MTDGYKRNGTTTLFAARDVLTGKVIGQCPKPFVWRANAEEILAKARRGSVALEHSAA